MTSCSSTSVNSCGSGAGAEAPGQTDENADKELKVLEEQYQALEKHVKGNQNTYELQAEKQPPAAKG